MEVGPVLHLADVIGSKVAAMVTRAEPRDYIDVAAALDRYNPEQLMELGLRADPALTDEEFADALRRFDRLDDEVFETLYGRTADECAEMRKRFESWPRM
jgi:predicted nucleotidyltransferase component of viral defense system